MIPELESLKLYVELIYESLDKNDVESHIWYGKFSTIIDEHHAMYINQNENENIPQSRK